MLTTLTSPCAGSAAASGPRAPVAQPEGRSAPTAGDARAWSRSRRNAIGRVVVRGPGFGPFEEKESDGRLAQPANTREISAGVGERTP